MILFLKVISNFGYKKVKSEHRGTEIELYKNSGYILNYIKMVKNIMEATLNLINRVLVSFYQ